MDSIQRYPYCADYRGCKHCSQLLRVWTAVLVGRMIVSILSPHIARNKRKKKHCPDSRTRGRDQIAWSLSPSALCPGLLSFPSGAQGLLRRGHGQLGAVRPPQLPPVRGAPRAHHVLRLLRYANNTPVSLRECRTRFIAQYW